MVVNIFANLAPPNYFSVAMALEIYFHCGFACVGHSQFHSILPVRNYFTNRNPIYKHSPAVPSILKNFTYWIPTAREIK